MTFIKTALFHKAGEGSGGGGGSVDYSRVIEKTSIIPAATSTELGKVYLYDGVSDSTYTHGYIYECVATQTATAVAFSGSIITSWAVADFVSYMQEGGSAYDEVTHGTLTYDASGGLWDLVGYDANGIEVMSFHEYTEDLEDFGCVFASGTHQDGDSCQFTLTTEQSGKKWKRLDVQPNNGGGGGGGDQHNLGWYATESALTTAHPTASNGDWAIVGATDTVWVWDSDSTGWKDTGQAGIELPDQTGNAGKFLTTDGTDASWGTTTNALTVQKTNTNVNFLYFDSSTISGVLKATGVTYVLDFSWVHNAFYTSNPYFSITVRQGSDNQFVYGYTFSKEYFRSESSTTTLGTSSYKWANTYTQKLNNGADITVPNVAGELAVKQVNTTITIAVADWNGGTTVTKTVAGVTATGIVLVSPDPTDQSAYTSAGILCTAQAADSLTFTCSTTPSADIDVNVVCL